MPTPTNPISILLTLSFLLPSLQSPLIDQLNQPPPPNFLAAVTAACLHRPSLPYCNSTSSDLPNIFKSTIVTTHLCNLSRNPNCPTSFLSINLQSLPKLAPLYLSFSFFWKYCPLSIKSIDLSNNSLSGPFPSQILQCRQILSLDLSRNMLTGSIPIESFTRLANLSHLNLSYNRFSPELGEKGANFIRGFKDSSFIDSGVVKSGKDYGFMVILLVVGVSALAASAIGCLAWRLMVKRHEFSEGAIRRATEGFSEDRLVERGDNVEGYRGRLRDGREVEIWILREKRRFVVEECRVLVKVRHKNIVEVLGWCDGREMRALVMKRVEGERLEEWLLRCGSWKERMKVAVEVADAMSFLEEEWPKISCDLRGDDVVVTQDGVPLIMKLRVHDHACNSSSRETYKFGVFLLKLITNKHPREEFEGSESRLVDWVAMHQQEKLRNVIDEKMKLSAETLEEATQAIEIGLICTDLSTDSLPTLTQISSMLREVFYKSSVIQSVHKHHHRTRNKKKETTERANSHMKG